MAAVGGATRPSSRYASLGSPTPPPSASRKHLPALRRLVGGGSSARRGQPDPATPAGDGGSSSSFSSSSSSRAMVSTRPGDHGPGGGQKIGSMVRKLMEKRSSRSGSSDVARLAVPPGRIAADLKKTMAAAAVEGTRKESSGLASLHRKLFQKGGSGSDRTPGRALEEVKTNTRTLAMVLRSERELLTQNTEYETEISQLRLLLEEKDREVEKLKDMCLNQREEIKALKDAILFPDVMNAQLQVMLEKQGSELKQAKRVIPVLQEQVTSLTGQLHCLAEDLAEVKADKYPARACFNGHATSPRTPVYDHEASNSLEFSSEDQITPGSPDDMFLKDMNPCLTPCFSKMKSKEYDEMMGSTCDSFGSSTISSSDMCFSSPPGKLSKSSERCQKPRLGRITQKTCRSDENKWIMAKPTH